MGNVIKKDQIKSVPITNREKILEIFPDADFEIFCPLGLIPCYKSPEDCDLEDCDLEDCEDCTSNFISAPYEPPQRMWSTAVNNTVDYKQN